MSRSWGKGVKGARKKRRERSRREGKNLFPKSKRISSRDNGKDTRNISYSLLTNCRLQTA